MHGTLRGQIALVEYIYTRSRTVIDFFKRIVKYISSVTHFGAVSRTRQERIAKVKKLPAPSSPERKKALREILIIRFLIILTQSYEIHCNDDLNLPGNCF